MKEMTVKEYFATKARMTNYCTIGCAVCAFHPDKTGKNYGCQRLELEHPDIAISIVREWSENNPAKTYLQDFVEKHPDAPLTAKGTPLICPDQIGYGGRNPKECMMTDENRCLKCWGRTMEVEF